MLSLNATLKCEPQFLILKTIFKNILRLVFLSRHKTFNDF